MYCIFNVMSYFTVGGASGSSQVYRTDIFPQPLESLSDKVVSDVACGLGHAIFLLTSGKVYAWGNGGNGRLGLGDTMDRADVCLVRGMVQPCYSVHLSYFIL
jgi:alpha-tubulin suppressor-like RCC1 family protein